MYAEALVVNCNYQYYLLCAKHDIATRHTKTSSQLHARQRNHDTTTTGQHEPTQSTTYAAAAAAALSAHLKIWLDRLLMMCV